MVGRTRINKGKYRKPCPVWLTRIFPLIIAVQDYQNKSPRELGQAIYQAYKNKNDLRPLLKEYTSKYDDRRTL